MAADAKGSWQHNGCHNFIKMALLPFLGAIHFFPQDHSAVCVCVSIHAWQHNFIFSSQLIGLSFHQSIWIFGYWVFNFFSFFAKTLSPQQCSAFASFRTWLQAVLATSVLSCSEIRAGTHSFQKVKRDVLYRLTVSFPGNCVVTHWYCISCPSGLISPSDVLGTGQN